MIVPSHDHENDSNSRFDLLSVVVVGLSNEIAEKKSGLELHRLLETFFSSGLSAVSKREIIEKEYGIVFSFSKEIERSVLEMCNVSQGILEEGIAKGKIDGKVELLYEDGFTIDQIANRLALSVAKVEEILSRLTK